MPKMSTERRDRWLWLSGMRPKFCLLRNSNPNFSLMSFYSDLLGRVTQELQTVRPTWSHGSAKAHKNSPWNHKITISVSDRIFLK